MELAFPKYEVAMNPVFPNRSEAEQQLCAETQGITLTAMLLREAEGDGAVVEIEDHPVETLLRDETGCVFSLVSSHVLKKAVEMKTKMWEEEYFAGR